MKAIIATPLYPPDIGGPATHSALLMRMLPSFGIVANVVSFGEVCHLPFGIRHLEYLLLLLRRSVRADVIIAEDTVSVGFPALVVARVLRIPLIVRVPGDHAWEQGTQRFGVRESLNDFQAKRYGFGVELMRSIARAVVRGAARVVVPSEYFARIVGGWMKDPANVTVIYNGIDFDLQAIPPPELPPKPFMVSVGRLVPWKGFSTLIGLLESLPEWSLVIVGSGPLKDELESIAHRHHVNDRVRFTGQLPRSSVLGWYEAADAFVLNSSFESFSYQTAEALAAGVPVIATNIGSIPELVEDGKEGVLVRPDDAAALTVAIESVVLDPAAWRSRVAAGKEKSVRFDATATARAFAQIIHSVIRR